MKYKLLFLSLIIHFGSINAQQVGWNDHRVGAPVLQMKMPQLLSTVSNIAAVAPDIVCLEIESCKILPSRQTSYQIDPADSLTVNRKTLLGEDYSVRVIRNGFPLGNLVGKNREILTTHERIVGEHLDMAIADKAATYMISSKSDKRFAKKKTPVQLWRKSKPTNWVEEERFGGEFFTAKHYIYLKLAEVLQEGSSYLIEVPTLNLDKTAFYFTFDSKINRSDAIHSSQVGFRSDDPVKKAYLSSWLGNGGAYAYPDGLPFFLIEDRSNQIVYSGVVQLSWPVAKEENIGIQSNHSKTNLYTIDFSNFTIPGKYRISVEGIGCGYPFYIDASHTWQNAFEISMKGLYHQRSGVSLLPPYTNFVRGRMYNPQDGVKVYQSTASYLYSGNGYNADGTQVNNFDTLVLGKTDYLVPEAWGGVVDAGDWDRQIRHIKGTTRKLLELFEFNPEYFKELNLNIPESGNNLPDIIDEALFQLDVYRRMQLPDGSIRGGIESSEHPAEGCASWQEMLTVFAYAPDHVSSFIYAAVAARASYVLKMIDCYELSLEYQESALRAMNWALNEEKNWRNSSAYKKVRADIEGAIVIEKNLAAVELYRLTNDKQWHELFLKTTYDNPARLEAAFLYARLSSEVVDENIRNKINKILTKEADKLVTLANGNAYGLTRGSKGNALGGWQGSLSVAGSDLLVQVHFLTGREVYLNTLLCSSLYTSGANPMNLTMTTGLGINSVQHPLHEDSRHTGQPAPIGITVCGPCELPVYAPYFEGFSKRLKRECTPNGIEWPTSESYFDIYGCDFQNEFVVDGHIGANAYIWGYLASRK